MHDFSDTHHQWDLFREYSKGKRVCEIGVHFGGSTRTFLQAPCASLISVELAPVAGIEDELRKIAEEAEVKWKFIVGNSLKVGPFLCEVLFLDSLHTKSQLLAELRRYGPLTSERILVHDTVFWGTAGEDKGPGLVEAVGEFVGRKVWEVEAVHEVFPGLTVLRRR